MSPDRYEFTEDWFSMRIPIFEKYVAPLAGFPCRLLEIGAYQGRATTWLADHALSHPEAHLDALDLHLKDELKRNIDKTGRSRQITLYEGRSREVLKNLPLSAYDFIYVDGSHSTIDVLEDAVLAFRLAKIGAIIAFDDYPWDEPPWNGYGVPKPALDVFLAHYAHPVRYERLVEVLKIETDWQVWVRKLADDRNPLVVKP